MTIQEKNQHRFLISLRMNHPRAQGREPGGLGEPPRAGGSGGGDRGEPGDGSAGIQGHL